MWNIEEEEERSDNCGLLQAINDLLRQDEFVQAKIVYNVKRGSLFFFFISLDFFIQILHQAISVFRPKYVMYPRTTPLNFFFLKGIMRTLKTGHGS